MTNYRLSYWSVVKQGWVKYHETTNEADMYAGLNILIGLGYQHIEVCVTKRNLQTLEPQLKGAVQCQSQKRS